MPDRLAEESDGILTWAVQGCLDWQETGLRVPLSCPSCHRQLPHVNEHHVGRFLAHLHYGGSNRYATSATCVNGTNGGVTTKANERGLRRPVRAPELTSRGFYCSKVLGNRNVRSWMGLGLLDEVHDDPGVLTRMSSQDASACERFRSRITRLYAHVWKCVGKTRSHVLATALSRCRFREPMATRWTTTDRPRSSPSPPTAACIGGSTVTGVGPGTTTGAVSGHRVAHCADPSSPYLRSGYIVLAAGHQHPAGVVGIVAATSTPAPSFLFLREPHNHADTCPATSLPVPAGACDPGGVAPDLGLCQDPHPSAFPTPICDKSIEVNK